MRKGSGATSSLAKDEPLRVVTIDIETSPMTAYVWGLFKQNISPEMIIRDWVILSVCAKVLGEPKPFYADVREYRTPDGYYDDSALLQIIWQILDSADVVVGQNSKRFDTKKINARLLAHGMPPPSPYLQVDTLLATRAVAAVSSGRLEWIGPLIANAQKSRHGKFPGMSLTKECLKGNPAAWEEMRRYNVRDVVVTEKLYTKLRPWIKGHPAFFSSGCPRCSSMDLQPRGTYRTGIGEYQRFRCGGCGGWTKARKALRRVSDSGAV